jgi:hypothetical protein
LRVQLHPTDRYKSTGDGLKTHPSKFLKYVSYSWKHNSYTIHLDTNGTSVFELTEAAEAFAEHFQLAYNTATPAGPTLSYCPVTFFTCLPLPN